MAIVRRNNARCLFGLVAGTGTKNLLVHAVSLGATETLICIPYLTTMLYLPPERRAAFGVAQNTVRLSLGIGSAETLIEDLEQALKQV